MAGGFMSGFGSAFAQSFNAAQQRRAAKEARQEQREDDLFKLRYTDYISQRDKRMELDKKNQTNVKKAKALANMYTGNEQAWPSIYDMVSNGVDDSAIIKYLSENEPEISPMAGTSDGSGPATPDQSLVKGAQGSVDSQMVSSGMVAPQSGGIFGDLKNTSTSPVNPNSPEQASRTTPSPVAPQGPQQPAAAGQFGYDTQKADQMAAEAAGVSQEQFAQTMSDEAPGDPLAGLPDFQIKWKPKKAAKFEDYFKAQDIIDAGLNVEKAEASGDPAQIQIAKEVYARVKAEEGIRAQIKADAEGLGFKAPMAAAYKDGNFVTWVNARGDKWVDGGKPVDPSFEIVPASKEMMEDIKIAGKNMIEPVRKYQETSTQFAGDVQLYKELLDLRQKNPGVAGAPGQVAALTDNLVRNAYGTIQLFKEKQAANPNAPVTTGMLQEVTKYEDELEKAAQEYVSKGVVDNIQNMSVARALYEAKALRAAYAKAAALGQTGTGVAVREIDNMMKEFTNPNDQAFAQGAQEYLAQQSQQLAMQKQALNELDASQKNFEAIYGVSSPFSSAVDSSEIMDQGTKDWLTGFMDDAASKDNVTSNPDQVNTAPAGMNPIGRTPDGKIVYQDKNGDKWVQ